MDTQMSHTLRLTEAVARAVPRRALLILYKYPGAAGYLSGFLNRRVDEAVPADPQIVAIASGPLRGCRMRLDLRTEEKRMWLDLWEPWVQDVLTSRLRPGMRAWDIGSYIGYYALLMRELCGRQGVVAVEPDPKNRARLCENLELNAADDITVEKSAVTSVDGTTTIERVPNEPMQTRTIAGGDLRVPAVTLDSLADRYGAPNLIKMDIEGGEADALRGARRLLDDIRPFWLLELHDERGLEALSTLERHGYRITTTRPDVSVREQMTSGRAHIAADWPA